MKKFWIILLALGLVVGFAMSASAQTSVRFTGNYYLAGIYADNPSLRDKSLNTAQAVYFQRLRIQPEFKIAEGLAFVARFDAVEKRWGDQSWAGTTDVVNRSSTGTAGVRTQENIEWERAYIDMTTKIGRFMIGYQDFVRWGTTFGDTGITIPGIKYFVPVGPVTLMAALEKRVERTNAITGAGGAGGAGANPFSDADSDVYDFAAIYKFGSGDAGLLWQHVNNRSNRPAGSVMRLNALLPYVKAKFGPVYFEAEGIYGFGDWNKFESPIVGAKDRSVEAMALYLHGRGDFGPAYVGGQFAYIRGDDWDTTDKIEGNIAAPFLLGDAFNPCLMMFSGEYTTWINGNLWGNVTGANPFTGSSNSIGTYMDNVWFYQIYAGFKPVKQADIMLSVTYAYADKKPRQAMGALGPGNREVVSDVYGTEVDLVAKYKIFDNLEYQIGAAYLFTGDYFKGFDKNNKIDNNYLLMHKLTLNF